MNNFPDSPEQTVQRVVSVLFGELKLSGCILHPHQLDLSCCKIRQTDGTALTTKQVWEVLNELQDENERRRKDIIRWVHRYEALQREMPNDKLRHGGENRDPATKPL
jgi:hypothetical protein